MHGDLIDVLSVLFDGEWVGWLDDDEIIVDEDDDDDEDEDDERVSL